MHKRAYLVLFVALSVVISALVLMAASTPSPADRATAAYSGRFEGIVPQAVETVYPQLPTITPWPTEPPQTPAPWPTPPPYDRFPALQDDWPNIAWIGGENNAATLWVGHYNDAPAPSITGARQAVRWHLTLDRGHHFADIAASPNGRYLAVQLFETCGGIYDPTPTAAPGEAPLPYSGECIENDVRHLFAVDLADNSVQSVPDYDHRSLYEQVHASDGGDPRISKLLGWFDDNRIAIADPNGQLWVATRDGSSYSGRLLPGPDGYVPLDGTSLLPDRRSLFAATPDKFVLRDTATGKVRTLGKRDVDLQCCLFSLCCELSLSPDKKTITYVATREPSIIDTPTYPVFDLWVEDVATGHHSHISRELSTVMYTSFASAWSPDGSKLAFTHSIKFQAGACMPDELCENDSDIYIADIPSTGVRQLTSFTAVRNTDLAWTPGGNFIMTSTFGSAAQVPRLVAASSSNGAVTVLAEPRAGEWFMRPTLFGSAGPPIPSGMPRVGGDPSLTTPPTAAP